MSISTYTVHCYGCNYQKTMPFLSSLTRPRYELPDGTLVDGHSGTAWCHTCKDIKVVEVKNISNPNDYFVIDPEPDKGLARLWAFRHSPPRCLSCFGTNISPLDFSTFTHECGNRLYQVSTGSVHIHTSGSLRPHFISLDSEGNKDLLLAHMLNEWHMKEEYARAFLFKYRDKISCIDVENLMLLKIDFAIVSEAYKAYKQADQYRGTPIETAIWGILYARSRIAAQVDFNMAEIIQLDHKKTFKSAYQMAFDDIPHRLGQPKKPDAPNSGNVKYNIDTVSKLFKNKA